MASQKLVQTHIDAQAKIRKATASAVRNVWDNLPGYEPENVPQFIAAATTIVGAGQRQAAATTNAFLARATDSKPRRLDYLQVVGSATRGGAPPKIVYRRPFVQLWFKRKNGMDFRVAVSQSGIRAETLAATDCQLAMRDTLREAGQMLNADPQTMDIWGYQRVPDGDACELCLIAAGQRYNTAELMPIHDNCGCGVDILESPSDPGQSIQSDRLAAILDGDTSITVEPHGELGPVLTNADHAFKSSNDLPYVPFVQG